MPNPAGPADEAEFERWMDVMLTALGRDDPLVPEETIAAWWEEERQRAYGDEPTAEAAMYERVKAHIEGDPAISDRLTRQAVEAAVGAVIAARGLEVDPKTGIARKCKDAP